MEMMQHDALQLRLSLSAFTSARARVLVWVEDQDHCSTEKHREAQSRHTVKRRGSATRKGPTNEPIACFEGQR
ncbi:uncharacterized [Tachysurus ichikawai]